MTSNNQELGQDRATPGKGPVDFDFLAAQTFGDEALQREVLALFVEQTADLVPRLAAMSPARQGETAHRLVGSARGIGAWAAAAAAQAYESTSGEARAARLGELRAAFAAATAAIEARLAQRSD